MPFVKGYKSFAYKGMNKGYHSSPKTEFKKGMIPWHKGKILGPNPAHSARMKGRISSRKGVKLSEEIKNKMRLAKLGKKQSPEHIMKKRLSNTGKRRSEEFRLKMRLIQLGNNNSMWKGGITQKINKLRICPEYRIWRRAVLERDKHRCIWCSSNVRLEADHIKPFAQYPELRFAIDNGRTLCHNCHKTTNTYGYKINIIRGAYK